MPPTASVLLSSAARILIRWQRLTRPCLLYTSALLARRIDWWIAHQAERAEWGEKYAEYTKAHYSVEASVHKFVDMERKAIGE